MSTTHHVITTVRHLQELSADERSALFKLIEQCEDSDISHASLALLAWRRIPEEERAKARKMIALEFEGIEATPVEGG